MGKKNHFPNNSSFSPSFSGTSAGNPHLLLPQHSSLFAKTFLSPFSPVLYQHPLPAMNLLILTVAEYLHRYLLLESEVELVICLTSKKHLKPRGVWNMAQLHPPQDKQYYLQADPTTILNSLKLKIAQLLSHLPADGQTIFNSGF